MSRDRPQAPRFQILKDRDGKHRWRVFNDAGTMIGEHRQGFATETEARRDAERFRKLIADAPIIGDE
jgi:hypothetical protein